MSFRTRWILFGSLLALVVGVSGPDARAQKGLEWGAKPDAGSKAKPLKSKGKKKVSAEKGGDAKATKPGDESTPAAKSGPFPLPKDLPKKPKLVVVRLNDEVSLGMSAFVERVIDGVAAGSVLVLDINTFGGRIDAAVSIRDLLLDARERGITTVAYIHPRAISAGALISYACQVIAVSPGATIGATAPVQVGESGEAKPAGEKVVSYMRKEMRATAQVYDRNGDIAEAMVDMDVEVVGLSAKGKLLTLDGRDALAWGVASFEARNLSALAAQLGYTSVGVDHTVEQARWNWSEKLAGWLSGSQVSGLLMSLGMLGLLIGLYSGGAPLPLTLGGLCLALFFFGQYLTHLAGAEDLLLLLAGLVLVGIEAFHPGLIIPGVLGAICILASLALGLVTFEKVPFSVQLEAGLLLRALATVMGSIFFTGVFGVLAFRFLPESRLAQRLVLKAAVSGRAQAEPKSKDPGYVGARGEVVTDLRPVGKVRIGGKRFEATAETGFIEAGQRVRVVRKQGYQMVVELDEGDEA